MLWNARYFMIGHFNQPAVGVDVVVVSVDSVDSFFHYIHSRSNGMMAISQLMISISLALVSTLSTLSTLIRCPKTDDPLIQTKILWNDRYFTFYQFNLVSVDSVDTSTTKTSDVSTLIRTPKTDDPLIQTNNQWNTVFFFSIYHAITLP